MACQFRETHIVIVTDSHSDFTRNLRSQCENVHIKWVIQLKKTEKVTDPHLQVIFFFNFYFATKFAWIQLEILCYYLVSDADIWKLTFYGI